MKHYYTARSTKHLKVLELFCGTKSVSNAFKERGHETYTVDWDASFAPDLCADIGGITLQDITKLCGGKPDIIWASPDCTTFSVAAISMHREKRDGLLYPKSEYAKRCDEIDTHLIELINQLAPLIWFIENPRGGMRKAVFMKGLNKYRHTITYCQYGDFRMKPTDIWTNIENPNFKPPCKNGDSCHEAAPRGSKAGTQSLPNAKEKARIPKQFCDYIVDLCEGVCG